jgi:hypothetical protein
MTPVQRQALVDAFEEVREGVVNQLVAHVMRQSYPDAYESAQEYVRIREAAQHVLARIDAENPTEEQALIMLAEYQHLAEVVSAEAQILRPTVWNRLLNFEDT